AKNNLSRASARRFLLTLQKLGYVSQDDQKFRLTAKVLELGYPYLASLNFTETITPFMEQVSLSGVNYLVRSATTMMAGWVVLLFTLSSLLKLLLSSVAFPL
ncbi:helix-turn-helix domain-containing protein, partial [Marinobacter sp. AC-23]|uniref:helix-turn-helix domain-containing protein n=1 Tax=Marinobacter sp. AC-23 TaxID=1879031 RepID=UPI0020C8377C